MPDDIELRRTLSEPAARQLANATKTHGSLSTRGLFVFGNAS